MADEGNTTASKPLAGLFAVTFRLMGIFFSGFLAMIGIGAVAGVIAFVVGYLFGNQLIALLASLLLAAGAQLIRWTGAIFNFFIEHLITRYSETLGTLGIMDGIDVVWTAFRDVANIALIGLFVFIAINIILGIKEFGEKKAVAKVLVVAVLINFSLLFTKVIVDASNFTAYQFYKSAGLERQASAAPSANTASSGGVADVFLYAAGVTSIGDTYKGVEALAKTQGKSVALAFTVVAALLLFVMVALFLYGAFQMISRAILLVFLMITSPLAFVSWLTPHSTVQASWKKWWEALISASFFSPIFMMALWASMLLLQRAGQARGNVTLGEFLTSPTISTQAWTLVVVYCFAIGLLYASIRLASLFAGSIAGFSMVSQGLRNALIGVPALGWRFGVAPLARQTIGRFGYFGREKLLESGREEGAAAGKLRHDADLAFMRGDMNKAERDRQYKLAEAREKKAGKFAVAAGRAETLAKAGYNLGDAGLAKQLAKAAGVSEIVAGQRPKEVDVGFGQQIASKVKLGEERMKALEVKPGEQRKIMEEEFKKVSERHAARAEELTRAHEEATRERDARAREVEPNVTAARRKLADSTREAEREKTALAQAWQGRLAELQREADSAAPGAAKDAALARISSETTTFNKNIKRQEAVVKGWERAIEEAEAPLKKASERLESAASELNKFSQDVDKEAQREGQARIQERQIGNVGTGEYLGRKSAGFYETEKVKREVAGGVAKSMRGKVGRGRLRETLARYRREFPDEFTGVAEETI